MVPRSAHAMSFRPQPFDDTSKVFIHTHAQAWRQPRLTMFCAENQMIMKAQIGGHENPALLAGTPFGVLSFFGFYPGVSLRATPGF